MLFTSWLQNVVKCGKTLYTFVLRAEICTTFGVKVVQISARNVEMYTKLVLFQGYIFRILQHFATKLCNVAIFEVLFLAVVTDFVFHRQIKI